MTYLEKIRQMSAEEIADFLWSHDQIDKNIEICDFCIHGEKNQNNCNVHRSCLKGVQAWFESEV